MIRDKKIQDKKIRDKITIKFRKKTIKKQVDNPRPKWYHLIVAFVRESAYAVVAELAYAHDSGSCPHYAGSGSSPVNCTISYKLLRISDRSLFYNLYYKTFDQTVFKKPKNGGRKDGRRKEDLNIIRRLQKERG